MMPLTGKTAIVTGGARRLGRGMALALAESGADVVVHYHTSATEAAATVAQIRGLGRSGWVLPANLADQSETDSLVDRAVDVAGGLDILVNNASTFESERISDTTVESLARNIHLHAMAPLTLARHFAAQNRSGHIVNVLDSRITDYDREHAAYHLSKRMLSSLTRILALELAPRIAVNAIAPGLILPPEGEDNEYLERLAHTNPMQRHGTVAEIARTVLFLVGAEFVTGQVIFVDGGRHMKGRVYD